jgi:hypothetical protein
MGDTFGRFSGLLSAVLGFCCYAGSMAAEGSSRLWIVPLTLELANAYVAAHHRHLGSVRGCASRARPPGPARGRGALRGSGRSRPRPARPL